MQILKSDIDEKTEGRFVMRRKTAIWFSAFLMSLTSITVPVYAKDETVTLNLEISDTEVRAGEEVILTVLLQDCSPNLASFNLEVFYDSEKFTIGIPDTSGRPAGGIISDNNKPTGSFFMSAMYSPDLTEVEDRELLVIPFKAKEDVSGTANFWIEDVAFGFNYGMDSVNEPKGNYAEGLEVQIVSEISQIVITDLEVPVKNQVPDTDVIASENIKVIDVVWTPDDEKFASDTTYTVTIFYKLEQGYALAKDAVASINGEQAELDQEKGTISYTFSKTEGKTPVEVNFIDPEKKEYDGKETLLSEVFQEAFCEKGKVVYQYNGKQYESLAEITEKVVDSGIYTIKAIYEDKEYYGESDASFEIMAKKVDVVWEEKNLIYNGQVQVPSAFYQDVAGEQRSLEVTGGKSEAGENYIAEVVSLGDKNYVLNETTVRKQFSIEKAELTVDELPTVQDVYGKSINELVLSGGKVKIKGTEDIVEGRWKYQTSGEIPNANTTIGYPAIFTPENGASNFKELTVLIIPSISKAMPTGMPIFSKITSSGKTLENVIINTAGILPDIGKFSWDLDVSTIIERGKTYSWHYRINDNYTELTGTIILWSPNTYDSFDNDEDDEDDEWGRERENYQIDARMRAILGSSVEVIEIKKSVDGSLIVTSNGSVVFQKKDGEPAKNEWKFVEGQWYYFDADFFAKAGWYRNQIGQWYYLDTNSKKMQTGWKQINQKWYYLDKINGDMKTEWILVDNKWYYLDSINGDMKTGWQLIKGKWYYFSANGEMQTGWKQIANKWYYLTQNGDCLLDTVTPDGYEVDKNGAWIP